MVPKLNIKLWIHGNIKVCTEYFHIMNETMQIMSDMCHITEQQEPPSTTAVLSLNCSTEPAQSMSILASLTDVKRWLRDFTVFLCKPM